MTNGNLSGLQFYLRRGFRLIAVRPGAVDRARELKPSIPLLGEHGIPIHDELDLCCVLDPDMRGLPAPAPWATTKHASDSRGATNIPETRVASSTTISTDCASAVSTAAVCSPDTLPGIRSAEPGLFSATELLA